MAVWSEISTSRLAGAKRLDAEFWQPKYLDKEKKIRSGNYTHLGALVATFKKGIFYILAREYADQGVPFYRSSNVGAILPNENNIAFITEKKHREEFKTALTTGDLMIVKTGKSGASVVFNESCNVSQDVIAVRANRNMINPYYLAAFLNTKYGKSEMDRWFQGQVQPHLSLEDAQKIWVSLIPDNAQVEVENLVIGSADTRYDAHRAYAQAQQLLESELGLDKLFFDKPVGYTAHFSELELSRRADAEFFHVKYEPFLSAARNYPHGCSSLRSQTTRSYPNFDARKQHGDFQYIEIGDISISNGSYSSNIMPADQLPANAKIRLSGGEILISQVRPTRGAIAIVSDILECETVCSGAFYVCTANDFGRREIIWLYLRCIRNVFEKFCGGTSYPTIDSRYLSQFPVPCFPDSLAEKIQKLIITSRVAAHKSHQLLDQAKSRVEQLIEEAGRP